jgi:hypothetical protein
MPARGAVRNDDRIGCGTTYRGKQGELGHLERHVDGVGAVAEAPGHAAAARLDGFNGELRHQLERRLDRRHDREGFLVAMAMQQSAPGDGLEREIEGALARRPLEMFLEQERVAGQQASVAVLDQRRNFVAKPEHAARLEADHRNPAARIWRKRSDAALRLAPSLLD